MSLGPKPPPAAAPPAKAAPEPREPARRSRSSGGGSRQSLGEAFTKSVLRTVGSQIGREIVRGMLGGLRRR
jgi:uncharacterized protein